MDLKGLQDVRLGADFEPGVLLAAEQPLRDHAQLRAELFRAHFQFVQERGG